MEQIEVNNIEIEDIKELNEVKTNELTLAERSHELMSDFKEYIRKSKEGSTVRKKTVRRVTAIFLIILALLTFFSNSIMNYSLPEVATVTVARGSVSKIVRCQGEARLSKDVEILLSGERVVKEVFFEDGDTVKEGDVIMSFEETENEALSEAEKSLEDMEYNYKKSQLRESTDYTDEEVEIQNAKNALTDAQTALEQARTDAASLEDAKVAQAEVQSRYDTKKTEVEGLQTKVDEYNKLEKYDGKTNVEKLISDLATAKEELAAIESELNSANDLVTSLSEKTTVAAAESDVTEKQQSLDSLERKLNTQKQSDNLVAQGNEMEDEKNLNEIEEQKEKIEKIKAESDFKEIKATASGIVTGISAKKGDKLEANTSVACIQMADSGYEVECSIPKTKAELVREGDSAVVENIWDDEISAVVKSVKADPSDPNQKSIVKFLVKGNVQTGETIQFSAGNKSDKYDTVVPNSAVKEDSKSSFLLVVKAKPTPLGNRYIVKRVDVEVQASDDSNSAVIGEIAERDNIVTNASKPLDNNQQVRLAK